MGRLAQKLSGCLQPGQKAYKSGGVVKDTESARGDIKVKGKVKDFENSKGDIEVKGKGKEGSKKEEKFDKSQFKCGGKAKK